MESRITEGRSSPKRDFRALLRGRNQHRNSKSNLLESIAQVKGAGSCVVSQTNEDGYVRMKLLVRKQDLRQMLELMNSGKSSTNHHQLSYSPSSSISIEQRLNLLRRKQLLRANAMKKSCHGSWTPELQSIPEEH